MLTTDPSVAERPVEACSIFLNYRECDEPFGAALLDFKLTERLGAAAVFRASRSIPIGTDFVPYLLTSLRRCSVLLAVIGPRWLDRTAGRFDWVRREIAEAFHHGLRVVPVLMMADLPAAEDLPADISALARCQFHRVHERTCEHDIDHLIDKLTPLLPGAGRMAVNGRTFRRHHPTRRARPPGGPYAADAATT